ncbi:glycoside hydrolase family 3 protein [Demequina flava]|uniref:glycoside hydrolase family 3 protein n=1 Tax=Demequina flava TaxID=1095025 RepID=UPI000780C4FF|nr:glycoside hydrolase family 3 N-terminal domain-containing protein [Demequina flava]
MTTTQQSQTRPWLDGTLPIEERIELLLGEMTIEEKAGLFFHTMTAAHALEEGDPAFNLPSGRDLVTDMHITHVNLLGAAPTARELAQWHNALQRIAAETRLGIPVTVSTDPRHSFTDNPGAAIMAGPFSQWPETLGLAAIGDEERVERFAEIARQEYTAVGLRVSLHPQIDLATEPRWSRQVATFGEDADLTGRLAAAYIRGFQGETFGPGSVSTMTKHFPGGGPQKDGEDPHFAYGKEQVYPGDHFDHHLAPFETAIEAGTRQMMPYYGIPMGTEHEEVGFGFNKSVITGLLRERFGFDGLVCTDWGLITDTSVMGEPFPARAWGVEHLSPRARMKKILDAGADQFGGEKCVETLVDLVTSGDVSQTRINVSARRILREKFELGLFDNPYVDEDAAEQVVGSAHFRAEGRQAQRDSVTVLTNDGTLPLQRGKRIYVEGIDEETASAYGEVVANPAQADVAIVRLHAPFDERATVFENFFHAGSLEFAQDVVDHIQEIAAAVPTVVDFALDRPAIIEPVVNVAHATTANWGTEGSCLLDVLCGQSEVRGTLPFDLPRSTAAIEASRPDVPFDTEDPLFRFGHGLNLS